jgi:hypothetical protein
MAEINKVKNNTSYSSQKSIEQMKNMNRDRTYDMFEGYGFEKPRTELIPLMSKTIDDYVESDTFFSRVKQIFKEK